MTTRPPARFALALLERLVPGSAVIAGDLMEQYDRRPSHWRVWREVLWAVALAWFERRDEIRPLRLVDLQPQDAIERTRRMGLHFTPINLTASPLDGIGGLGIALLLLLTTLVMPGAWWLVLGSMLMGIVLGVVLIHRNSAG